MLEVFHIYSDATVYGFVLAVFEMLILKSVIYSLQGVQRYNYLV